jgi:hypothetical protein
VFKQIGRIALAVLVTLALSLGLTAFAGSATAASTASSCSSEHTAVHKAKKHVKKDKKKLKAAKRHHNKAAVKKAKKRLARDRARLVAARNAYNACLAGPAAPAPAPGGTTTPPPAASNPVTDQCNAVAGQIAAQDPTGAFASGAAAFCDLLGQLAGASGGDPLAICDTLAAGDPTGQLSTLCDALGTSGLPSLPTGGGLPGVPGLPGLPGLPGVPTDGGGLIGDTLGDLCDQIASQDPTDQLGQLCDALHSLPI